MMGGMHYREIEYMCLKGHAIHRTGWLVCSFGIRSCPVCSVSVEIGCCIPHLFLFNSSYLLSG